MLKEARPLGTAGSAPLGLDEFQRFAVETDRSGLDGERRLQFLLLGLFGEVGSLLSELKKKQRDRNSYFAYERSAQEETGDVLWYLANVADALGATLTGIATGGPAGMGDPLIGPRAMIRDFRSLHGQHELFLLPASDEHVQRSLLGVAARVGRLVQRAGTPDAERPELLTDLGRLFAAMVAAAKDAHINLESAARGNMEKVLGRWPRDRVHTPLFDENFDQDERLPRRLEVTFQEKKVNGVDYVLQSVHGINLGDRLTDNSADGDDYRFHDVFHLAYAAILGWSPVLRALLRLKRKSVKELDEQQDGARAIIAEEGISNWIFAHGLRHQAFEGVESLDFNLLRTIRQMVKGYEVEACPMWMWEDAILQGFAAFRQLKVRRGGLVVADLERRSLTFTAVV